MHEAVPVHTHAMPKVQTDGPTPDLFLEGCWIPHISVGAPWAQAPTPSNGSRPCGSHCRASYLFLHKSLLCISGVT